MRFPKPFFRKQTQTWYVQLAKKQHNLGSDKEEAERKYRALMAGKQEATDDTHVITILTQFLEWAKDRKSDESYRLFARHCGSFGRFCGKLTIGKLRNRHVTEWIEAKYGPPRSDNYRRSAIRCVQRALNWAVKEGWLTHSPIATYEKPAYTPRDTIITPEQWQELIAAIQARGKAGARFLDFVTILRQTGCRPQEARAIEARHLDRKKRCIVFERSESKGKVIRRVVPLTDLAFDLLVPLADQYPDGPILRNSVSQPWTTDVVKDWFHRLSGDGRCKDKNRERYPRISFKTSAYIIRHTWATEAMENGVDPITVAKLMGHKDIRMLMQVYAHIEKKSGAMRAALEKATGKPVSDIALQTAVA